MELSELCRPVEGLFPFLYTVTELVTHCRWAISICKPHKSNYESHREMSGCTYTLFAIAWSGLMLRDQTKHSNISLSALFIAKIVFITHEVPGIVPEQIRSTPTPMLASQCCILIDRCLLVSRRQLQNGYQAVVSVKGELLLAGGQLAQWYIDRTDASINQIILHGWLAVGRDIEYILCEYCALSQHTKVKPAVKCWRCWEPDETFPCQMFFVLLWLVRGWFLNFSG